LLAALLAVAVIAGVIVWATSGGGGSSGPPGPPSVPHIGPMGLSAQGLGAFATGTLKQPVYWAGPKDKYVYELTRTSNGNVYVRYLPPGVNVGGKEGALLIVATYPYPNALARLKAISNGTGTSLPGGGLALPAAGYPKSVHVAFPGVDYEIEVFDPRPKRARQVADSGDIQLVR